jgi:hypothetical protein
MFDLVREISRRVVSELKILGSRVEDTWKQS